MVSVGARVPFSPPFGVEAAAASGFGWLKVQTVAGSTEVSMQALTFHAYLDPWADRLASLSFGLGGGIAYASALGTPAEGYASHYDSTTVGLFTLRIGGTLRGSNLSLVAFVEPGILAPPVTLTSSGREIARLGRP
jgi:hypothetical protein